MGLRPKEKGGCDRSRTSDPYDVNVDEVEKQSTFARDFPFGVYYVLIYNISTEIKSS